MINQAGKIIVIFCCLAGFDEAASAPAQLYGKSIIITWSENRVQRNVGEANFRSVRARHEFSIYISSAGRIFSRLTNTTRSGTGSTDQVGGMAGATRVPTFTGQSMTIFMPSQSGIRRLAVDFDSGFSNCSAKVTRAKQEGSSTIVATSNITGRRVEIQSVTTSGESCAIRSGNVFGGM